MNLLNHFRWVFYDKTLTPDHTRFARVRLFYWHVLRWNESETCQRCGTAVRLVFHAPDHIWEAITGNARSPGGEAGGGILCIHCVDLLAEKKGLPLLYWTCSTDDSVMRG